MKIAFVTNYDARDVRHWSGLGFFIARALTRNGIDLEYFGPLSIGPLTWLLVKSKGFWYNRLGRSRYIRNHDRLVAHHYARRVERRLARHPDVDLVFSPGAIPIAFVRDQRPIAYWSDATHAGIFDFYAEYTGLCRENIGDGHRIEQAALDRATAAIFTSEWAAESARCDYGVPHDHIHVVPFGANIDDPPVDEDVEQFIHARPRDRCRLLFLGVDWERKGGPLVVEVASLLNREGLKTELTVAGCRPYRDGNTPPFVNVEGFLSKGDPAGNSRLRELLATHHFLIVPSIAECYGLVYCEANAFGMPCLARRVGGVPTIISNGENGFLFDRATGPAAYAMALRTAFSNYDQYLTMAHQARKRYNELLNWSIAGRRAAEILQACCQRKRDERA